ncbi:MAG TPA: GAF domain-containing protein [Gaiellaceae bacterium]|nr:GAF domain-containing protein [Gaiellaceae bacterium]
MSVASLLHPQEESGWRASVQRSLPVTLGLSAVGFTAGGVFVSAVSRHGPHPEAHAAITAFVSLSFAAAAIAAARRPPYVRFGCLLAAVGFASLLGALHDANTPVPYTIGVLTSNLVFAVLVHALLAFPKGRLITRRNRLLAAVAYVNVLVLQGVAVLFDPLTRWPSGHPRNAALLSSHATVATALEEIQAGIALALTLAVFIALFRRMHAETAVTRRLLVPVLVGGKIALLLFSVGLVLAPLSSGAAVFGIGLGLLASVALPASFLGVLLQGRLSNGAVGELLVELRGRQPRSLQDALRRALGDPALRLARIRPEDGAYVDGRGELLALPTPGERRVATRVVHQGDPVGVLVHDRSLHLRPELLDAVNAAAGFALANERALTTVQRVEARNQALLSAIPDLMLRIDADGTYLDACGDEVELPLRAEELIGRNVRDFAPPEAADAILACARRALASGEMHSVEYELEIGGAVYYCESRMVPTGDGEVVIIMRDFTRKRRGDAELRRLAEEQAALRRVATLVASDAPPEQVFQLVTEEVCRLLGIREAVLVRFEDSTSGTIVGRYGMHMLGGFEVGSALPIEHGLPAWAVLHTGEPARVESFDELPGVFADRVRKLGYRSAVGVPIVVAASTWGTLVAALREDETLPPETERRMQAFAELVALALASAQARDDLAASRLRIVEAADAERRRLERNLHDGAQQRLVALSVALGMAQRMIAGSPDEAHELLAGAMEELGEAIVELRELAQGIHPAVLTERGLASALEVLAARAPLPVELDVSLQERLPEQVEAAAYYVASEGLANVVKHARAATARVRVARENGHVTVAVEDDGMGGAAFDGGSGLYGLRDRVETLAGRFRVESGPGSGTTLRAELPLR